MDVYKVVAWWMGALTVITAILGFSSVYFTSEEPSLLTSIAAGVGGAIIGAIIGGIISYKKVSQ